MPTARSQTVPETPREPSAKVTLRSIVQLPSSPGWTVQLSFPAHRKRRFPTHVRDRERSDSGGRVLSGYGWVRFDPDYTDWKPMFRRAGPGNRRTAESRGAPYRVER